MPRKPHIVLTALTTLTILLLLLRHHTVPPTRHQALHPANTTLGFGTILAVSRPHSQRLPGLLWAANLTDLSISIPTQPDWTDAELRSFRLDTDSAISEGSAMAWQGHLHTLKHSLESGKETALILEDDADWDISVRTHQIALLAHHMRALLPSGPIPRHNEKSYWPDTSHWDILYPGHCDDALPSPSNGFLSHPHTSYVDTTTPAHAVLHPDTSNFLRLLRIPEGTRFLSRSFAPLCTVAYAVHRASAVRIVEEFGREREGVGAFDVQLLRTCGEGWRCYSVSPELFHHVDGRSEIAGVDSGAGIGVEEMKGMGKGTWNVRCGARDGQLWFDVGDHGGRGEAKKAVREMSERDCPIDLVKAESSWRGCEWTECGAQS